MSIREKQPPAERLVVATYSTFVSHLGPGPDIVRRFKESCHCDVEVINAGDSVVMLKRLVAKGDQFVADVVLGLDPLTLAQAEKEMSWRPVNVSREDWIPELKEFSNEKFVPFDWSPMTFVYRAGEIEPPTSLSDLRAERFQKAIALQDPKLSTPGLQFVIWVFTQWGDKALEFLNQLKPSVQSVSPSWAQSYSAFKRAQAKLVFTYQTSVVFHWLEENDHSYQAASFDEGHPYQVEFASIPANCRSCALAEQFLSHLVSAESQKTLMMKNYMFPVLNDVIAGTPFQNLTKLNLIPWTRAENSLKDMDQKAAEAARALQ